MKNKLLFLFSLVLIIGFSACTKTEYIDRENPNRTVRFDINDWKSTDGGITWFFETDQIPEIDDLILASGTVLADVSFESGVWIPLNTVKAGVAYRMDYSKSYILVEAQYSGGFEDDILPKPSPAKLKVLLFDSELID
jgi:hypothetical protein